MKFQKIVLPFLASLFLSLSAFAQSSPEDRMARHDAQVMMDRDKGELADYQTKLNRLDYAIQEGDTENALIMKKVLIEIMTKEVDQGKEKIAMAAKVKEAPAPEQAPQPEVKAKKKKKKKKSKKVKVAETIPTPVVETKPQPDFAGQKIITQQQESILKKIEANLATANITLFKVFSELMQRDVKATYPGS